MRVRIAELSQRIEQNAKNTEAYVERGVARRHLADYEASEAHARLYADAWNDFADAHELAGGAWDFPDPMEAVERQRLGKPAPAPVKRKATPEAGPGQGSVRALIEGARLCSRLYQFQIAAQLVGQAAKIDPKDPHVRVAQIQLAALATGDFSGAVKKLDALAKEPEFQNNGDLWFALGRSRTEAGDPNSAEQAYRRAIELGYEVRATRTNLAAVLSKAGRHEEAAALYNELRRNPNNLFAHNN